MKFRVSLDKFILHSDLKLDNLFVPTDEITGLPTGLIVADFDTSLIPRLFIEKGESGPPFGTVEYIPPSDLVWLSSRAPKPLRWLGNSDAEKVQDALKFDVIALGIIGQILLLDDVPSWFESKLLMDCADRRDYSSYVQIFRPTLAWFLNSPLKRNPDFTETEHRFELKLKLILNDAMKEDSQKRITSSDLLRRLVEIENSLHP